MSEPRDELLESSYDGIQEYDNDLPRWWVYLFIGTVVLSLGYTWYVHAMNTPTDQEQLAQEMQDLAARRAAFDQAHAPKATGPESLLALVSDSARVQKGKAAFVTRCVACHGPNAEGLVGPNLTDEFWLHGGKIEDIQKTISVGVPAKGMLAWKGILSQEEIDELTAYLWSIRNTNVKGKGPEGEKS